MVAVAVVAVAVVAMAVVAVAVVAVAVVAVAVVAMTLHIAVGEGPEKPFCRLLIHFDMDQF